MIEVYCDNPKCNWKGRILELISFEIGTRQYCPNCGEPDSIFQADAVSTDDYEMQEKLTLPAH
jgi:hypothetical protein